MSSKLSGLQYRQVDVFSEHPLSGNGLAVFWKSEGLSEELVQRLTREMRQFESIFLSRLQERTFRARIFTMEEELAFAGHPVLGAAAVLHEQYGQQPSETWALDLKAKQVTVTSRRRGAGYRATMDQGRPQFSPPLSATEALPFWAALNLSPENQATGYSLQVVSTGLPYLIVPVESGLEKTQIVHSHFEALLEAVGAKFVYVLDVEAREGRTWDNEGRVEDIATGSAAGPASAYLFRHGTVPTAERIVLHQGRFVGRPSEMEVKIEGSRTQIERAYVSGSVSMVAGGVFD